MNYNKILFKHFGALAEDVLKIESLLRAGDNELAAQVSQCIPNYEEKMLEVYKEYYPTFWGFVQKRSRGIGDYFKIFQYYHFILDVKIDNLLHQLTGLEKQTAFFFFKKVKKCRRLELPYYCRKFNIRGCFIKRHKKGITILNCGDLQDFCEMELGNNTIIFDTVPPNLTKVAGDILNANELIKVVDGGDWRKNITHLCIGELDTPLKLNYSDIHISPNLKHLSINTYQLSLEGCGKDMPTLSGLSVWITPEMEFFNVLKDFLPNVKEIRIKYDVLLWKNVILLHRYLNTSVYQPLLKMGFEKTNQRSHAYFNCVTFENKNI